MLGSYTRTSQGEETVHRNPGRERPRPLQKTTQPAKQTNSTKLSHGLATFYHRNNHKYKKKRTLKAIAMGTAESKEKKNNTVIIFSPKGFQQPEG